MRKNFNPPCLMEIDPCHLRARLRNDGDQSLLFQHLQSVAHRGLADTIERAEIIARPLHSTRQAVAYELRRAGRIVHRQGIPAEPPPVPDVAARKHRGGLTLKFKGERQNRAASYSVILESEAGKRYTIARTRKAELPAIETSTLPVAGMATIFDAVHDGVRSTGVSADRRARREPDPSIRSALVGNRLLA